MNARELTANTISQRLNPRINIGLKYLTSAEQQISPEPDCRSTGTVDRPPHSGRPDGRPRKPESWVPAVKALRSTRRSTSQNPVHAVHVGRPARSTDPPVFCCCCYFLPLSLCLSSSTSLAIFDGTWQSSTALGMASPPLISSLLQQKVIRNNTRI